MKEDWEVKGDYSFLLGASVTLIFNAYDNSSIFFKH